MLENPFEGPPKAVPTDGEKPTTPEGLTEKEQDQAEAAMRFLAVAYNRLNETLQNKNPSPEMLEAIREIIGDTQTTKALENIVRTFAEAEEQREITSEKPNTETAKEQRAETERNLKRIFEDHIDHHTE